MQSNTDKIDDILNRLGELWKPASFFRLGQLMYNLEQYIKQDGHDIFYVNNEELLQYLNDYLMGKPINK